MNTTKKENLDRILLSVKPKLVISERIQNQIDYLHEKYDVEWSGELITREEGSISNPSEWKIIAEDIYLADIGTSGYTKYDVGDTSWKEDDILGMYEQFPGLMEGTHKNQHIHSHNSMATFFSSTDEEQLEDRAATSNYLLMLIVNFKREYCAKVAFKARKKSRGEISLEMCNNTDGYTEMVINGDIGGEVLVVMDCEIEYEKQKEEESNFIKRCKKVKEDKKSVVYSSSNTKTTKTYYQGNLYNNDDTEWNPKTNKWESVKGGLSNKSVMEMTDSEWEEFNKEEETPSKKFDDNDCKSFLNAITDKMITVNTKFPLDRMKKLKKTDKISLCERIENESFEYFTDLFTSNDFAEYLSFLETLKTYITSYKFVDEVFFDIIDLIEEEIADISESIYGNLQQ